MKSSANPPMSDAYLIGTSINGANPTVTESVTLPADGSEIQVVFVREESLPIGSTVFPQIENISDATRGAIVTELEFYLSFKT